MTVFSDQERFMTACGQTVSEYNLTSSTYTEI
jgi:hypothetical protein